MEKRESTKEQGQKIYEVGYLLVPTIAEEQVAGEVETIKSVIAKYEGAFITEDFPKLRPLAYTMAKSANGALKQKFDKAYFGWIKFEATANGANLIKAELDKNASILRFLLINTVRENTMIGSKVAFKTSTEGEKPVKTTDEAMPINPEELDKTIDNLIVE